MASAGIQIRPINGGFAGLGKRAQNAMVHVLNRVATSARATGAKAIAEDLGAKQAAVRKAVIVKKATFDTMESLVVASGKRIPLIEFVKNTAGQYLSQLVAAQRRGMRGFGRGRARGGGVPYTLRGKRSVAGSFIARMPSGHVGIFRRLGKKRLKIIELFGPSMTLVFSKSKVQTAVRATIRARMPVEMKSAARFYGGGGGK